MQVYGWEHHQYMGIFFPIGMFENTGGELFFSATTDQSDGAIIDHRQHLVTKKNGVSKSTNLNSPTDAVICYYRYSTYYYSCCYSSSSTGVFLFQYLLLLFSTILWVNLKVRPCYLYMEMITINGYVDNYSLVIITVICIYLYYHQLLFFSPYFCYCYHYSILIQYYLQSLSSSTVVFFLFSLLLLSTIYWQ